MTENYLTTQCSYTTTLKCACGALIAVDLGRDEALAKFQDIGWRWLEIAALDLPTRNGKFFQAALCPDCRNELSDKLGAKL